MRDHDQETKQDGAQGQPPLKTKTGGEQDRAHKHPDAHPDLLRDERLAHPANAEPLAELLSQLQHSHGNAYVQRVVSEAGEEKAAEAKPAAEAREQSGAQALDAGTKSQMESALGEDFGDVRVHTGRGAGDAAQQLGARAFTRGRDIYFSEGEYNPSTQEGKQLLAHELTHVVQQRGGSSAQGTSVGRVGDAHEREADDVAASVIGGERVHIERHAAAPAYQRQDAGVRTPPPHSTPPASFGTATYSVSAENPVGSLPNGITFRYIPFRPGPSDCVLDFVVPEGVRATASSSLLTTFVHQVVEGRGRGVREWAVVVSVGGTDSRSGLVAVTFRFTDARGIATTLGVAMFNLPRLPQSGAQPRR